MGRRRGIPGLSFSWKRALGISAAKGRLSRKIGIPLTKSGRERKLGRLLWFMLPFATSTGGSPQTVSQAGGGNTAGCAAKSCGCGCLSLFILAVLMGSCARMASTDLSKPPAVVVQATPEPPLIVPTKRPTPSPTPSMASINAEILAATQAKDLPRFKAAFAAAQQAGMTSTVQQLESTGWVKYFREQEQIANVTSTNVAPAGTPITTLPAEDPLADTYVDHDPPALINGMAFMRIGNQSYPLHTLPASGTLYGITGPDRSTGQTTWILHMANCSKLIGHPEVVPVVGAQVAAYSSYCGSCLVVEESDNYNGTHGRTFRSKAEVEAEKAEQMNPTVYVTASGKAYHRAGCRHVRGSATAMKKLEAERAGYYSCGTCNP